VLSCFVLILAILAPTGKFQSVIPDEYDWHAIYFYRDVSCSQLETVALTRYTTCGDSKLFTVCDGKGGALVYECTPNCATCDVSNKTVEEISQCVAIGDGSKREMCGTAKEIMATLPLQQWVVTVRGVARKYFL